MAQVPRIVFSPLSKSWYVVTRYREKHGVGLDGQHHSYIIATVKHDVTDQMKAILESRKTRRARL